MLDLARKIALSEELVKKIEELNQKESEKIKSTAERCLSDSFAILGKRDLLFRLAVILFLAVKVRERYDQAGISEEIYYDTMSDIKIWAEKSGGKGLKNYSWLKNHVNFELFRLGRLQFQLYECKNRTLLYNKLPFNYGDKVIYVHIPEGEKLLKEKCEASFKKANEFFNSYFPGFNYSYYFCESWLLYEGNREFMAKESNIVSFISLFNHAYSVKFEEQAIERIFGKRRILKKSYPEETALQKRAKKYMQGRNRLGIGIGFIEKERYNK